MNSSIELLNSWGARFLDFALPMLWQSTLLIAPVLGFDFLLRRKLRPGVRYALWFAIFIKLLLPPTLALPTGAAWWLRSRPVPIPPHMRTVTVSYADVGETAAAPEVVKTSVPSPGPKLSSAACAMVVSAAVSTLLLAWLLFRWHRMTRSVRRTGPPPEEISELLIEARENAGLSGQIRLRITSEAMSPAVCGLFRPTILLPQSLITTLSPEQIRAVLLHELIHLRRRDVWVNCGQTLLQIFYWWHPLLWLANARIRRLREEAVDDAVMLALNEEAEIYAPTLLEVAKLAFNRPLPSLGLVGILESRNALRQRIERLLNFSAPRRAGLSVVSVICIAAFSALAVPMGEPPAHPVQSDTLSDSEPLIMFRAKVNPEIFNRNLKARAVETMHTPADDPKDILNSILESFGVDSTPPRSLTFDVHTGEITAQNTSEALGIMDEVVKELNLPGGEHILNPPHNLKQVLIEAQFYEIRPEDAGKLHLMWHSSHQGGELTPWWELSPDNLTEAQQRLKELGVQPLSSPRIHTSHGVAATLSVGDGTNNLQLECLPFVRDGLVNLTALARTSGKYAPGGKGWPDVAGHTNCAIFSRISIHDGDGAGFVAGQAGTATKLLILLKARILEPVAPAKPAATRTGRNQAAPEASGTSAELHKIHDELISITFDKISFSDMSLDEVLRELTVKTRERDPEHVGINFFISKTSPVNTFDSRTRQPIPAAQAQDDTDVHAIKINFDRELRNVQLADVLDAITKSADHPIKCSILDSGIEFFSLREPATPRSQVTIKVRFVEVETNFASKLGYDWYLGPPDHSHPWPSMATLKEDQFRTILKAIGKRNGAELLSECQVVTLSGREAQMEMSDSVTNANHDVIEKRATIEATATVAPDGHTIQLALNPSWFITLAPGSPSSPAHTQSSNSVPLTTLAQVLPPSHGFAYPTNCIADDGQTVVLGNFHDSFSHYDSNGNSKTLDFSEVRNKRLLVFVTPTIVDAAGNRVHGAGIDDTVLR